MLLNSSYVMKVMQVVAPTMHFHIGYVGLVPVAHGVVEGLQRVQLLTSLRRHEQTGTLRKRRGISS